MEKLTILLLVAALLVLTQARTERRRVKSRKTSSTYDDEMATFCWSYWNEFQYSYPYTYVQPCLTLGKACTTNSDCCSKYCNTKMCKINWEG
nr:conotoxin Im6.2 [Conus imperialis]